MLTVTMVGASFCPAEAKEIVRGLHIGAKVQLVADPNNEYDPCAVAVYSDDVHIGFVPRDSNSAVFARLMDGEEIEAEVVAFESSLKPIIEIPFDAADDYKANAAISETSSDEQPSVD